MTEEEKKLKRKNEIQRIKQGEQERGVREVKKIRLEENKKEKKIKSYCAQSKLHC